MKKWIYLACAFLLGVVAASSGKAIAAQVKSVVGQKVTGEYTIVVNGEKLQDKGAVIDGRTNAPVRALSDALGADLKVDNTTKTVEINTTESNVSDKEVLLEKKAKLENTIATFTKERDETQAKYDKLRIIPETGEREGGLPLKQAIDSYNEGISAKQKELDEVNEALKSFE